MPFVTAIQACSQPNSLQTLWSGLHRRSTTWVDGRAAYGDKFLNAERLDLPRLVIAGGSTFLSQRWRCLAQMG
jgi:hypothetical protein